MSIPILKPWRIEETTAYDLVFTYDEPRGSGFSFPCNAKGEVFMEELTDLGKENLAHCLNGTDGLINRGVRPYTHTYRAPAEARCTCGEIVYLDDPLDNLCTCGRCYNMSGQSVTPSWECDEQGEPYEVN